MIALVLLSFSVTGIIAQGLTYCRTPLGRPGRCINIKSCDTLINLLRTQSNNPEVRSYVLRSSCGYEGTLPLVCCPELGRNLDPNPSPNTFPTARPTTRTTRTTPSTTTTTEKQKEDIEDSNLLPNYPNCGLTNSSDFRVVGGTPASLGQFPWIAALGYSNPKNPGQPRWLCGGSLITARHVLTAAHCVKGRDDLQLARLGELELYSDDEGANPIDVPIVNKVVHEDYNTAHYTNDIAVLTLASKVSHPSVWPICLPTEPSLRTKNLDNYYGFVAGWGSIYFNGPSSNVLQYASLPIVSTSTCKDAFASIRNAIIDENVLCAGYKEGGKDSCKGDSGGPFMYPMKKVDNRFAYYLVGVVSYGIKCAEPGYYGVYSSTGAFLSWIMENLR